MYDGEEKEGAATTELALLARTSSSSTSDLIMIEGAFSVKWKDPLGFSPFSKDACSRRPIATRHIELWLKVLIDLVRVKIDTFMRNLVITIDDMTCTLNLYT